jgi:hypothetical protein
MGNLIHLGLPSALFYLMLLCSVSSIKSFLDAFSRRLGEIEANGVAKKTRTAIILSVLGKLLLVITIVSVVFLFMFVLASSAF